ncbi:hypothetical protein CS542_06510 [Pedobacter sp. IW39]|nr:hypothetical protein CS542_06510 [Pedobacter sp. IW39]
MITEFNRLKASGISDRRIVLKGTLEVKACINDRDGCFTVFCQWHFLPGAEVQKPLATVVIGGLHFEILTLLVYLCYTCFENFKRAKEITRFADGLFRRQKLCGPGKRQGCHCAASGRNRID